MTLTVKFAVEVSESGRAIQGAKLAVFDGAEPDGDTFVDEAPALSDVPGRRATKLRLGYDAKTKQLSCLLLMELDRPLDGDELELLRDEWLPELERGFDNPEKWKIAPEVEGRPRHRREFRRGDGDRSGGEAFATEACEDALGAEARAEEASIGLEPSGMQPRPDRTDTPADGARRDPTSW